MCCVPLSHSKTYCSCLLNLVRVLLAQTSFFSLFQDSSPCHVRQFSSVLSSSKSLRMQSMSSARLVMKLLINVDPIFKHWLSSSCHHVLGHFSSCPAISRSTISLLGQPKHPCFTNHSGVGDKLSIFKVQSIQFKAVLLGGKKATKPKKLKRCRKKRKLEKATGRSGTSLITATTENKPDKPGVFYVCLAWGRKGMSVFLLCYDISVGFANIFWTELDGDFAEQNWGYMEHRIAHCFLCVTSFYVTGIFSGFSGLYNL